MSGDVRELAWITIAVCAPALVVSACIALIVWSLDATPVSASADVPERQTATTDAQGGVDVLMVHNTNGPYVWRIEDRETGATCYFAGDQGGVGMACIRPVGKGGAE